MSALLWAIRGSDSPSLCLWTISLKFTLRTTNFAIELTLRLPSAPTARQILLSNWQRNEWHYFMTDDAAGTMSFVLRRNINTNGASPMQGLVNAAAKVPVGTLFAAFYVYEIIRRTPSGYTHGALSASAVVRSEITDLTLHNSTQSYVQF